MSNIFFNDNHKLIKILFSLILYYKKSDSKKYKYLSIFNEKIIIKYTMLYNVQRYIIKDKHKNFEILIYMKSILMILTLLKMQLCNFNNKG